MFIWTVEEKNSCKWLNLRFLSLTPLPPLYRTLLLEKMAAAVWPRRPLCRGQRLPEGQPVGSGGRRRAAGESYWMKEDPRNSVTMILVLVLVLYCPVKQDEGPQNFSLKLYIVINANIRQALYTNMVVYILAMLACCSANSVCMLT